MAKNKLKIVFLKKYSSVVVVVVHLEMTSLKKGIKKKKPVKTLLNF